jgi:hypothetical protein
VEVMGVFVSVFPRRRQSQRDSQRTTYGPFGGGRRTTYGPFCGIGQHTDRFARSFGQTREVRRKKVLTCSRSGQFEF